MNQILQIENKKNKGPVEIGKVVIFFAIAIILFAVILIGLGAYNVVKKKEETKNTPEVVQNQKPEVNVTKEDDEIVIQVTHNLPISKLTYRWNEEEEENIQTNNQTEITEKITLPFGTNTLEISVIDTNGNETKYQREYVLEGNGKPVIDLKLTTDNKIKITAQDNAKLKYIIYQWNNNEPKTVEVNSQNPTILEEITEIPLGQNTLKVQAVNTSDVTTTKELEVKGVKKPVVTFKKNGDTLKIRAEDEGTMKEVRYTLNGREYIIQYKNKKVIEYDQPLQPGENNIELTAENVDGGITKKKVKVMN